ncbi:MULTISPECIES: condensation domain-containing protein [unclassified Microbacterium]|uniref:condensation domain-containing protein n=1 Tax=unclassified Microbacterium TaxID=2609290 RepID=UPI0021584126|nr:MULTISPECIES: condensation domain-containing protein [unclassified Microbacterium]
MPLPANNLSAVYEISGPLDASRLERAFRRLFERHEALRFTYDDRAEVPRNAGVSDVPFVLNRSTGSPTPEELTRYQMRRFKGDDLKLAAYLWSEGAGRFVLCLVADHLAVDRLSWEIVEKDLSFLYSSPEKAGPESVPSYFSFAADQQRSSRGQEGERRLDYWRRRLDPLAPLGEEVMPGAHAPQGSGRTTSWVRWHYARDLSALSRRFRVTPFALILATHILSRARSGVSVRTTHVPVGLRPPEYSRSVGWFSSSIVHRHRVDPGESFRSLCAGVMASVFEGVSNHLPIPYLQERLQPARLAFKGWRPGCFIDVQDLRVAVSMRLDGCQVNARPPLEAGVARDGSASFFLISDSGVDLMLRYQAEAWSRSGAESFARSLGEYWDAVDANPDISVGTLLRQ